MFFVQEPRLLQKSGEGVVMFFFKSQGVADEWGGCGDVLFKSHLSCCRRVEGVVMFYSRAKVIAEEWGGSGDVLLKSHFYSRAKVVDVLFKSQWDGRDDFILFKSQWDGRGDDFSDSDSLFSNPKYIHNLLYIYINICINTGYNYFMYILRAPQGVCNSI